MMKCKCDGAENKQLSNVWKVHYFCFQRLRSHPSANFAQHWLINNQMVHNETILWGHGKRSSVFKENIRLHCDSRYSAHKWAPETCPPWLPLEGFFTRHNVNTHGSFSSNKLSRRYHFIPAPESMVVIFICQHLNTKSKSQNEEARVLVQRCNTEIINLSNM